MKSKNIWMWATATLLCTTLAVSYGAVHYYTQMEVTRKNYESLLSDLEALTMFVNLKIDYGNGTVVWYNGTRVPIDATLLTATKIVGDVEYSVSDLGVFINEINGVGGDTNCFWLWYYWDQDIDDWAFGPVGCGQWVLHNGDIVSWTYTAF